MFERLAGNLLGNFLSKYFTEESLAKNKVSNSAQLGVWSGYISLQNLELKKDAINNILDRKGQPFELVQCSFRQVEITIPWAKISNPINATSSREDAVVVLVLDGIHLLVKTRFDFNDVAMRTEEISKRREALKEAVGTISSSEEDENLGFTDTIKKRITGGLLQEITDKLHVHVRDLHIRLEDVESDPTNPYACGITMESMHIHHNDKPAANNSSPSEHVVRKVVQLNHFAAYWNTCDYGPGLPVENSVLHQTCWGDADRLSRSLNFCISRRASLIASPSRNPSIPSHTYLLLPVDGMMYLNLSTTPNDLRIQPAMDVTISLDSVSTQFRDFQCVQILRLSDEVKNHNFVKEYRNYRPLVDVKDDPRAWWLYASKVIRYQLKENFLRFSWSRFGEGYRSRRRYMELYGRKIRFPSLKQEETLARLERLGESDILNRSRHSQLQLASLTDATRTVQNGHSAPDAGAGPSAPLQIREQNPLNYDELVELQNWEDGLLGDLSISDILLYQAIVNVRSGRTMNNSTNRNNRNESWWKSTIASAADDSEAKEEFDRLLKFVDEKRDNKEAPLLKNRHQIAVLVMVRLEDVAVSFFSPSHLTIGESQLRQLHEKFLEFTILDIRLGMSLKGDYKTLDYQMSVSDFLGTEIRSDKSRHVILSQVAKDGPSTNEDLNQPSREDPLFFVTLTKNPPSAALCDMELVVFLNEIELKLTPECQWIGYSKELVKQVSKLPNVAEFWEDISIAYVNSVALGRLGLLAKAESIAEENKNIDIDITIKCPIIRIADGSGCDLLIDLGSAYFKTEKLAGVSRAKLQELPFAESQADVSNLFGDVVSTSIDDGSVMGSLAGPTPMKYRFELGTPKRKKGSYSVSSAVSVGSRAGRSYAGSLYFDDTVSFHNGGGGDFSVGGKTRKGAHNQNINEVFYDVYQFRLQTGKISFSTEAELFDISSGFQISTTLKKSIIPSDHTICKLKSNTVIDNLSFDLNERAILHIGNTIKTWKRLAAVDLPRSRNHISERTAPIWGTHYERATLVVPRRAPSPIEEDPIVEEAGSASQVDEVEFFDANDGYDSVGGSSGIWFDDHWIADAESVISDSRSVGSKRRKGKRRSSSIGEASSVSDQSAGKGRKTQGPLGTYLSAENLARLEEGVSEDDDSLVDASDMGSDDDSFHSVMSSGGQIQVLNELEENIKTTENKILQLSENLEDMSLSAGFSDLGEGEQKERRKIRKAIKIEITRTKAELNVLRALHYDMKSLLDDDVTEEGLIIIDEADDAKLLNRNRNQHAKNARALLEAKKQRDSITSLNGVHNLTRDLNQEVFQGSVLLGQLQITIHLGGEQSDESGNENYQVFQLIASQTAVAISKHVHDTKIYFSVDQLTASVGDKVDTQVPSRLLISCGSPDTLLPTHFPHLISRSMEERFFRGTLNIAKRRGADLQITQSTKLRLVLGDMEVVPSEQFVSPLAKFLSRFQAAEGAVGAPEKLPATAQEITAASEKSTEIVSVEKPSKYFDIAFRLTSLRVVFSHDNQYNGAFGVTELSTRYVEISSPLKNRIQLDVQCTNIQLLEIASLETGHGSEILGRRDPYNFLVQMRVRSQIVPSHEAGGWVVGVENRKVENCLIPPSAAVRNVHIGVRLNPIALVASPEGVSGIVKSGGEIQEILAPQRKVVSKSVATKVKKRVHRASRMEPSSALVTPVRWRLDASLRRIAISFPGATNNEWSAADDANSKMMVAFTTVASLQELDAIPGYLSLRSGVTDISIIRSTDDWVILEPFSIVSDMTLEQDLSKHGIETLSGVNNVHLKMPHGSPLNEIAAVMHQYDSEPVSFDESSPTQLGVITKVTPIRANFSAPVIGLLVDTTRTFIATLSAAKSKKETSSDLSSATPADNSASPRMISLHLSVEEIQCPVFFEGDSRTIANAKTLFSFTLEDMVVDFDQKEKTTASVFIRNSAIFDFSSKHGIRVIGEDPTGQKLVNPYFVRVKLFTSKHGDGPQIIRLAINWGHIQCLLIPAFVKSVMSLQNDVEAIIGTSTQKNAGEPDGDSLMRFLTKPKDINLILSADAESFECILPSKDVVEYVKEGETDPIGVVSLRWKASLGMAIALDCLKEGSVPWVTLDLNGTFTDKKDSGLFKDFADRYLAQSSGFLAGSDETGHKLVNAFTSRVSLKVKDFQVLRTDISSLPVESSTKRGSGLSYASKSRIGFSVCPPLAGEQRITNPIDLNLLYRAVGASMSGISDAKISDPQVEVSQLLQLDANFVDILLYISQGERGFTEALKTTIKPLMDIFQPKGTRRKKEDAKAKDSAQGVAKSDLRSLIRSASSLCTIRLEGFQVTCVPGGATNLNESPIIKFELSGFSSGLAVLPVPKDARKEWMAERNRTGIEGGHISGYNVLHLTASGWIDCEITAHYHNRRLVAWEPFVEPWAANIRFGTNLVEAFKMKPTLKRSDHESAKSGFDPWILGNLNEGASERLREFGRLFRAPFQSATSLKPSQNISHTDFCYLMLASTARSSILSVQYPAIESQNDRETRLFFSLPGQDPMGWLHGFGFPDIPRKDSHEAGEHEFSISCLLSDQRPLNVNLTGALIENVLGYLDNAKKDHLKTVAPHWIRNDCGMTIRFREVLDTDRFKRGERAGKTVLANGSEVPLTLKRSLSQSCDPHRAYIYLELGSFEDTVGRIEHDNFEISKGSRSSSFFFKAAAKIPVDMVGVHRYPLDRNIEPRADAKVVGTDSRSLGWIIVRVALRGGINVISVESPFVIKSASDADLLCEVRDQSRLSILWRCWVPKSDNQETEKQSEFVSVPADIVPFIHDESFSFSVVALARGSRPIHEAELSSERFEEAIEISAPPPFSHQSIKKGLVDEKEVVLSTLSLENATSGDAEYLYHSLEKVHLSICSVRIGSFSEVSTAVNVPEQRMIFFRSPLVIRNFLALPISVQVRVKQFHSLSRNEISSPKSSQKKADQLLSRKDTVYMDWEDLGVIDCGQSVNWTGALSSDKVQLRVRIVGLDGDNSRRFPGWSSVVSIPTKDQASPNLNLSGNAFAHLRVSDADDVPLDLSVALETGNSTSDGDPANIRHFSEHFSSGTRVVSIFVPYWIVDSTNEDLEFFAGAPVAGQLDKHVQIDGRGSDEDVHGSTLGLAELLDNENFLNLPSRSPFDVMMIGDRMSTRMTVRKRVSRLSRGTVWRHHSPWSDPIPLQAERNSNHDSTVLAYKESSKVDSDDPGRFDRFVLRSTLLKAPESFGGGLGTMLIHVVNRYAIINEIGRDIEIMSDNDNGNTFLLRAASRPQSFHFDDSKPIRFRFKEFGWNWSGKFNIRMNRREVTMRLRHKMKGDTVIVTVENRVEKKSSTCLLIFRETSHPPFRLENHTMYPLNFGQSSTRVASEESDVDAMLLPYQSADFAWDEPELRRRALIIRSSGLANGQDFSLGRFFLDRLVPGANLRLENNLFAGEVVADGPTRILRITDASMPRISNSRNDEVNDFQQKQETKTPVTISLMARLSHGVGISVVDWVPQELLYARLDDIQIERNIDPKKDAVHLAVGNIKLNNQLWVTPYPVLLKMGRKSDLNGSVRRNRRHDALSLAWRRPLDSHGGYGNVTLLERVEFSSEPIFANVDGYLVGLLLRMSRQIAGITADDNQNVALSRDDKLKNILYVVGDHTSHNPTALPRKPIAIFNQDADGELLTTAAIAAKLKTQPLPLVKIQPQISIGRRKEKRETLSKPTHKYYIEKLRISATKADISWSGPIPGRVSNLLFRALTFERLPLRLRPYSSSHSYGNKEDHGQALKSHYLSFWRIADLLLGLSYNPTFLSRAVVYTFRESVASSLESLSNAWTDNAKIVMRILPEPVEFQPIYDDGLPMEATTPKSVVLKKAVLGPFVRTTAFSLRCASAVTSWIAGILKYGSQGSKRLVTRGLVRSRNPRLFAHVDGKDLLVEYVEGENSGKALLSRVRMGVHLSEGYIFHTEEARQLKAKSKSKSDLDPAPLIFMMTSERMLLLNGKLDADFCAVEWETIFLNLVNVELLEEEDISQPLPESTMQQVVIWYLSDTEAKDADEEGVITNYPGVLALGIDVLRSKCISVPGTIAKQMIEKIENLNRENEAQ